MFTTQLLISHARCLLLVISWLLVDYSTASWNAKKPFNYEKMLPRDAFPPPIFDKDAPYCSSSNEPCGFYTFGSLPFKWVKSWCQCPPSSQCIFDRTDTKMRVFRQHCVPLSEANQSPTFTMPTFESIGQSGERHHHGKNRRHRNVKHHHRRHVIRESEQKREIDQDISDLIILN
ncbi:hypothetical protein M3Y98_00839800 [Aphelenchoides besseyi]|nr:hypothetical protein M3Y98_00839800 [Aphelenchoides besseyi]KAI6195502.1 hypothetical protein M3Y96_01238200 [Aphelenchoides besseyi]